MSNFSNFAPFNFDGVLHNIRNEVASKRPSYSDNDNCVQCGATMITEDDEKKCSDDSSHSQCGAI